MEEQTGTEKGIRSSRLRIHGEYDLVSIVDGNETVQESVRVTSLDIGAGWFDAVPVETPLWGGKPRRYSMAEVGLPSDVPVEWSCPENGRYVLERPRTNPPE